jgi:hypothetical protein
MKLLDRYRERRHRKAHQQYLAERERQRELEAQDTPRRMKEISRDAGVAGQSIDSHW